MKAQFKFIFYATLLMMVWLPAFAQNYFERTILYDDSLFNNQLETILIPTKDQNLLLFTSRMVPGTNEIFLSTCDNSGTELWTSRILTQQPSYFFSITEFCDSTFYISGLISGSGYFGNLVVHVSKDGLLISAKVISSPDIFLGYGFDITALNDSALVLASRTSPVTNFYHSGNIIIDGSGNPVSNKFFLVNNKNIVQAKTAKSPNGGFVQLLEMRRHNVITDRILGVISCDANGNIIWAKQFGDLSISYQIFDIKQLPTGEIILCGRYPSGATSYGMVMCIDANGNLLWTRHFNPAKIAFSSIASNDVSSFIVTGTLSDTSSLRKAVVIKMGLNGQILDDASYRYTDIIVNNQSSFKDDNNMFYTSYNYRLTGTYYWGTMISKYDLGFNFCNPYNLSITTTAVIMADSAQWTDTTFSLVTTDVTSLYSQIFDPWGYGIHCISTGIDQAPEHTALWEIFPNPTTGKLVIRSESLVSAKAHFKIIDLYGKVRLSGSFDSLENKLDISGLGKGVYFIQTQSHGQTSTKKIILN